RGIFEAPWATPILGPAWPPKPAPPQKVVLDWCRAESFSQKQSCNNADSNHQHNASKEEDDDLLSACHQDVHHFAVRGELFRGSVFLGFYRHLTTLLQVAALHLMVCKTN
ncbi:MAG: hypothetical protein AAFN77_24415, partial [Planctomycetota bacterium]